QIGMSRWDRGRSHRTPLLSLRRDRTVANPEPLTEWARRSATRDTVTTPARGNVGSDVGAALGGARVRLGDTARFGGHVMRRSTDRILTPHVGALPAPDDVWAQLEVSEERLAEAVAEVCDKQTSIGIDFINEGELTKGGHWTQNLAARLGGHGP